jgi:tetratricopeptide (TPR) repeat protein
MITLLALLLGADAAAPPATIVVAPFAVKGGAQPWVGVAVAESMLDVVVQANRDSFFDLKQLDTVLRRRDLRLDDLKGAGAVELARALGATDVITGEAKLEGGSWSIKSARVKVADGSIVDTANADGPAAALPAIAQKLGRALLDVEGSDAPVTKDMKALELATRCEMQLAGQPLGALSKMTLSAEQLEEAGQQCKGALAIDPEFALARAGLALTLAARGKFNEARAEAQRARKDRFVPLAVLAEAYAIRRMHAPVAWSALLVEAVRERPGFLHALGYLAEDRMELGEDLEALELFDLYLQRSPNHPWAMSRKARQLARLLRFNEAIALSERALSLNPGDPELLIETASRYIDAGRFPRAEPLLKQAMGATPPRPRAALRLAYLYIRRHKLSEARAALEKCLQQAGREDEARTRGLAHADLARIDAKQNKYAAAIAELQKARAEGNNHLPCREPELARWKERPELKCLCVESAAASTDDNADDNFPGDL